MLSRDWYKNVSLNDTTSVIRRPNAYRYLAAMAAICQHGLRSEDETEALAAIKAIAEDAPRWISRCGLPRNHPAAELIPILMARARLLGIEPARIEPQRTLKAGG